MSKVHELKCWPDYFEQIDEGKKTFEFRKDDRGFKEGDYLRLREWNVKDRSYTGRELICYVSYILGSVGFNGIPEGWVIMSIRCLKKICLFVIPEL